MEQNQTILGGIDPEIKDRLVSRRDAIRKGATASAMLTWGLSLGSVPVALAAMSKEAFGQAPSDILDALQFAFILENLENEFYKAVLNVGDATNATQRAAFAPVRTAVGALAQGAAITSTLAQIQKHEQAHVDFIRAAITGAGGTAPTITAADFDFTGGNGAGNGPFLRATAEPQFLLLAAQAFEDTGVRAYKGQAGRFLIASNQAADVALEAALRIHSVEARHAAKIRNVRRDLNTGETVIRYSGTVRGGTRTAAGGAPVTPAPDAAVLAALDLIYANEQNTSHVVNNGTADVTIDVATAVTGLGTIGTGQALTDAITEAFDEPLTKQQVIDIVKSFIKDDAGRGLP